MSVEGKLSIVISCEDGKRNGVSITSTRPVHASQIFHGKSVTETLKMLPLLFNICGTAQACAAVRASEAALGITVLPETNTLREQLVRMETIKEHLWRILNDWPLFNDEPPDQAGMAEVLSTQREYRKVLCNEDNPFQPGATVHCHEYANSEIVLNRLKTLLEGKVFGMQLEQWLDFEKPDEIEAWANQQQGHAAKLIHRVIEAGWADAGRCEVEPLPELEPSQLYSSMQVSTYIEQPEWQGHACETTTLTRTRSALLKMLATEYGNGLLVRLIARLTELAKLAVELEGIRDSLNDSVLTPADALPHNFGIGEVEAARGRLVHLLEVECGNIKEYQILAPTEWNFHPSGVVVDALTNLQGNHDKVEQQARLLINAIDPCVGYELSVC